MLTRLSTPPPKLISCNNASKQILPGQRSSSVFPKNPYLSRRTGYDSVGALHGADRQGGRRVSASRVRGVRRRDGSRRPVADRGVQGVDFILVAELRKYSWRQERPWSRASGDGASTLATITSSARNRPGVRGRASMAQPPRRPSASRTPRHYARCFGCS